MRAAERFERTIVKRGIKRNSHLMQLLDHGDIQPLRGGQHFDVAAPARRRNRLLEKWLAKKNFRNRERIGPGFSGAKAALRAEGNARRHVG